MPVGAGGHRLHRPVKPLLIFIRTTRPTTAIFPSAGIVIGRKEDRGLSKYGKALESGKSPDLERRSEHGWIHTLNATFYTQENRYQSTIRLAQCGDANTAR